jgi:(4-(4-[2-(gamma-L-glutamylamino)ethyl]phenoxymethyl)furan-2-yl)methanamine synthase
VVSFLGWDIGAANVKAAWLEREPNKAKNGRQVRVTSQPFEIWREKDRLPEVLRAVYTRTVLDGAPRVAAITITAELSDVFATKREGVLFVLESVRSSFPDLQNYVLNLSGDFVPLEVAQICPLECAATNWIATAQWFARQFPNGLLLDVGSTTTDILPVLDGRVCVAGRTDMERLASGELVFTGVLRTNPAAIVQSVPVSGQICRVASEYFAVSGDVHLILGHIRLQDYNCSTPDGQPPSIESARSRLARLVCADIEMLTATEIDGIANYIYAQQVWQVRDGINQVLSRLPRLRRHPVIALGAGAFLGLAAAKSLDLEILDLAGEWNREELAVAPCVAAAHLLAEQLERRQP